MGSGAPIATSWTQDRCDGVAVLTFTRPPRNFLSFAAMTELHSQLVDIGDDDTVQVVVLTSSVPGYFAAHGDLDDLLDLAQGRDLGGDPRIWDRTLRLIEELPQPVVAAVDGQAWGGGCELALACTMCIASDNASFAFPEVDLGIIPGAGGTVRLPRRIGTARAAELILTGRMIDAREAERIGLVQVLMPADGFAEHVRDWAASVAARPHAALRAATAALQRARGQTDVDALRHEARLFLALQQGAEAQQLERSALRRYESTPPATRVALDRLSPE